MNPFRKQLKMYNQALLQRLTLRESEKKSELLAFLEKKADSSLSFLQITAKLEKFEVDLEKKEDEIESLKEVIRQLLGGLFNQRTQGDILDLHLAQIYTGEIKKIDESKVNIWPTTRQGDAHEIRIEELEKKVKALMSREVRQPSEEKIAKLEESISRLSSLEGRISDMEKIVNRILG